MEDCRETPTIVDIALAAAPEDAPEVVNGDLIHKIAQLRVDLELCSADKRALRSWADDMR